MAECPCHEDRTPSLSITQMLNEDSRILVNCFGCGATNRAVCAAVDVDPRDLFPRSPPGDSSGPPVLDATYTYEDSAGTPVMRTLRFRERNGKKTFRAKRYRNGEWEWGAPTNPADRPLYRLPEVLDQVAAGGVVYVVEGEKDVETLRRQGVVATTNPFGAGKWLPHHTESLAGAKVFLITDNDDTGLAHALQVAGELRRAGAQVEVLRPAVGKDISDHIGAGLGLADLEIVPEGVENEFTQFVELLRGFDPTLPVEILFEMAEVLLGERDEDVSPDSSPEHSDDSDILRQRLRSYRIEKSRELGVPPYVIFDNATMEELIRIRPRDHRELLAVRGIGPWRAEHLGEELLQILRGEPEL